MPSKLSFEEQRRAIVERLVREGVLKTPSVIKSVLKVPREEFIPPEMRDQAYFDTPLPIGYGQTISAPHMCAIMNEALELQIGHKVLEIGAGSGYHAALVAEAVAPSDVDRSLWGRVYTVEIVPELVEFAKRNLERAGYADRVTVVHGDGSKGYPPEAPYDRIFVTASAPSIPPPLVEQLKPNGILILPIGGPYFSQQLVLVRKRPDGKVQRRFLGSVMFVLLRGKHGWSV